MQTSHDPPRNGDKPSNLKKKRHTKNPDSVKPKRLKGREEQSSPPNEDRTAPSDQLFFPPEVLEALKRSLRGDIIQICQQTVRATVPHTDTPSTPSPPPPPKKPRTQHLLDRDGRKSRLTKTAKKRAIQLDQGEDAGNDKDADDNEDEDDDLDTFKPFSSDEDQEEDAAEDNIVRFFKAEDYQQLVTKCLSALDLKDKQPQDGAAGSYTHPKNTLWGSSDYFPKRATMEKVLPFPIFFEQQLCAEWEAPATPRRSPAVIRKLYLLPKFTDDFLKVPVADAPILDLQSSGLLNEDGQGTIRDPKDWKIEYDLRRAYNSSAMAVRASSSASIVARAMIVWAKKLLDLFP